jgi:hypothetical protein
MTPAFGTARVSVSPGTASTTSDSQAPIEPPLDWTPPATPVDSASMDTGSVDTGSIEIGSGDTASVDIIEQPRERDRERKPSPRVRRLKAFLESLDLTMYHISQVTARTPFGKGTRAHIRDAFYAELDSGQTPDIHQVAALAKITGHRFIDWLALFGYHVGDLLKLQLEFLTERTVLLPNVLYDPLVSVPWVRRLDPHADLDHTQPLAMLIDAMGYEPIGALDKLNRKRYLYARIGKRDDMLRSRLAAGSVVRVDPTQTTVAPVGTHHRPIYLVQHLGGLCCCYVERLDEHHIVLLPDDGASHFMRCRVGAEAVILGTVDTELRPLLAQPADVPAGPREKYQGSHRMRLFESLPDVQQGPGAFARLSRERLGICFREAQAMTRALAKRFEDKHYNVALGSLSDAETQNILPRHIPKILSLCAVYGMDMWQYLRAGSVPVDDLHGAPIPPQYLSDEEAPINAVPLMPSTPTSEATITATEMIMNRLGEIPFFLLRYMGDLIGQEQLSLDDVYVWGQRERALHPMLQGAILLIVNRRQRRVPDARMRLSLSQRPLFLIRTPSGQLLAGMCAVDGDVLLVQPHNASRTPVLSFQARDVEVIGRISAVLRTIHSNGNGVSAEKNAEKNQEKMQLAAAAAESRAAEARP